TTTPVPTYEIGDKVWLDTNGDDIQNGGTEPGIAGVQVQLVDKATGTVIETQTTDVNGNYLFTGLKPGDYTVVFDTPKPVTNPDGTTTNYTEVTSVNEQTDGDNSNVASQDVTITNANNYTIDRGFRTTTTPVTPPEEPTYTLGDKVWEDDGDGVQEPGEPGIPGVTVTLTKPDGTTVTTTTDANGNYEFTDLPKGSYEVTFETPSGYVPTDGDGTDDTTNSDPKYPTNNVTTGTVQVDLTGNNPNVDAGFVKEKPPVTPPEEPKYTIGDKVWEDDGDGVQEPGEPGIPGVTVTLTKPDGTTVTATTDSNGNYEFEDLPKGSYEVTFTTPSGYVPTDGDGTDDTTNSDPKYPTNNVTTGTVQVDLTGNNPNVDAGFVKEKPPVIPPVVVEETKYKLGDFVWNDLNHNGVQDIGEPGIEDVTVSLVKPDGSIVKTTTDKNGHYEFNNLPKGTYTIYFETPAGMIQTGVDKGTNDAIDSDGSVVTIELTEDNMTIDSGFYNPTGESPTTPSKPTMPGEGTKTPTPSAPGETEPPVPNGPTTPGELEPPAPNGPTQPMKPVNTGKVTLPDTGEAENNGAASGLTLTLGALALLASRRKK
ncbi:SdrD B-like domain-containing protein, partial [Macrococcus sp. DPC7161]|uniref:SdrD B-like domain-containing protein n=1 Tax=Macrococcus sp. DPC7161 TaxID=2507060 RepID=UPI00100C2DAE